MPSSYAYHLTFELYPTPVPTTAPETYDDGLPVWRPGPGASIFDDLPWEAAGDGADNSRRGGGRGRRRGLEQQGGAGAVLPVRTKHGGGGSAGDDDDGDRSNASENKTTTKTTPPRAPAAGLGPETAARDWRFGRVRIASVDMNRDGRRDEEGGAEGNRGDGGGDGGEHRPTPAASLGPVLGGAGQDTRGRFDPLATQVTDAGWGIVHLYREGGGGGSARDDEYGGGGQDGRDGTILCVPAVPSYMAPRDFLGFVGESWSRDISHVRMVLTSRTNRYMVLLKFRDAPRARAWRAAFDGRVFNSMEAEICHVAFIKSITIETPASLGGAEAAPQLQLQSQPQPGAAEEPQQSGAEPPRPAVPHRLSHSGKAPAVPPDASLRPRPPPTANLVELPTCPVCLERMDDTAGIMTILCQHVFHCTCLQTWKGSGCPVCRATNPSSMAAAAAASASGGGGAADDPYAQPFGAGAVSNLCSVCDCADDLWICLICGNVGCGRYKGGHAKEHWKETMHSFSLELETQHVWDYAGDAWVHRLLRDKGDGKIVELPGRGARRRRRRGGRHPQAGGSRGGAAAVGEGDEEDDDDDDDDDEGDDDEVADVVPRAKLDRIGFEYTHLLTSQLESQRVYFEELVNKAADKAAQAAAAAEAATGQAAEARRELAALRAAHAALAETAVPALERDVARERRRADKAAELARGLGQSLQDEKRVAEGLLVRVHHVQGQLAGLQQQLAAAQAEAAELRETNRDLTMFISGQEKLRALEAEGQVAAGEVAEGTVSLPEEKTGRGKGKGRRR